VPINVTLLFSAQHYLAAAEAYLRGIERRIAAGLNPVVESVASVFISRWDVAVQERASEELRGTLGVSVAALVYARYREVLADRRSQRAFNFGALPQRLLWASTGTKDPKATPTYYVDALVMPFSINTMPDVTLKALADKESAPQLMSTDTTAAERILTDFAVTGVHVETLGRELQDAGANSFQKSWDELMAVLMAAITAADIATAGTAQVAENGTYSETKFVASFIGFAPATDPRLLVAVIVDQPQGDIYGGSVAAPAFGKIAQYALPYLGVPPE